MPHNISKYDTDKEYYEALLIFDEIISGKSKQRIPRPKPVDLDVVYREALSVFEDMIRGDRCRYCKSRSDRKKVCVDNVDYDVYDEYIELRDLVDYLVSNPLKKKRKIPKKRG